jgi:NCS1 family nucleobase:cation symporter-1
MGSDDRAGRDELDAAHDSALTTVEQRGAEPIPEDERRGKPHTQFTIFASTNLAFAVVLTGFFPAFLGLSLVQCVTAIVIGTGVASIVIGVLSAMGSRLGVAAPILARGPLGFLGAYPMVAYTSVFGALGWATVNLVFGAWALQGVVDLPLAPIVIVVAIAQAVIAIYGYDMVHLIARVTTIAMAVVFALMTILAIGKADFSFGVNPQAADFIGQWGGWFTAAGVFFAYVIGYATFAADYSRYLPADTPAWRVAGYSALGNFVPTVWLGCLGAVIAGYAGALEAVPGIEKLTGGFAPFILLTLALSTIAINTVNIYGGALSVIALVPRISRPAAVVALAAGSAVLAIWLEGDLYGSFYDFLLLTAYIATPFAVIMILDYYVGGRNDPGRVGELYDRSRTSSWGLAAWLGACLASVPFWSWKHYTGPFAAAHPDWGDLTYPVGAIVGGLLYLLIHRLTAPRAVTPALAEPAAVAEVGELV